VISTKFDESARVPEDWIAVLDTFRIGPVTFRVPELELVDDRDKSKMLPVSLIAPPPE
jgi:hypothetical protein